MLPKNAIRRFWARVDRTGNPADCWLWRGYIHAKGYGRLKFGPRRREKHIYAHRVAFWLQYPDTEIDTERVLPCPANRHCCNPRHLALDDRPRLKLNQQLADEMRAMLADGATVDECAQRYGVTRHTVYMVRKNILWRATC